MCVVCVTIKPAPPDVAQLFSLGRYACIVSIRCKHRQPALTIWIYIINGPAHEVATGSNELVVESDVSKVSSIASYSVFLWRLTWLEYK